MSALDGLRALAVGLVLLFHAWNQQPDFLVPGQWEERYPMYYTRSGVHLFFVLSGFLLFLPYARWLLGRGPRPSAAKFGLCRFLHNPNLPPRTTSRFWLTLTSSRRRPQASPARSPSP
jgi:peptidoglycan/LPS O-acetylase OafA/YrhL